MKKSTYLLILLLFFVGSAFAQQDDGKKNEKHNETVDTRIDNLHYWVKLAEQDKVPFNQPVPFEPAKFLSTKIKGGSGLRIDDSPDVPVNDATNITESENSIFVDPSDPNYVLNSNNSTGWSGSSVTTLYGANYFQSSDGGVNWGGSKYGAGGSNSGDPTTAIGLNGRQFVNYISDPGGQGCAYSDNGTNWTAVTVAPNPGSLADKNHMWIDNSPSSAYEGNLYVAWTDFGGSYDSEIVLSRSTNNGVSWTSRVPLSTAINAGSHNQGVNISTGPNGEVYVAWAVYDGWPTDETAIGFTKSTNGGSSFSTASRIIQNIRGIRTTETSKNHRVNSFPSMAVDISGGPNNGNIYIVWANVGVPGQNTGSNISVYMSKSTNGGASWSTPIRVNQGSFVSGKEAYFPWITCDPETGTLSVVFYDDRNTGSSQCETWVANSFDGGDTWEDFRVSDVAFTPAPISGLAGGYFGDYLGISARAGIVYPVWTDNRDAGRAMTYCSPFILGINASFSADNTNVCTGSAVNFTDNSTGPIPITSWQWQFPGGTPSSYNGENPPPIYYNSPGTYNVTLTVSDGTNSDTETYTGYIVVEDIIANFEGTPTIVVVGNSVTFTDLSDCNPTSWQWSFPGGTPSNYTGQTPPPVFYNTEGTYNVSLTVSNGTYSDTETKTAYITALPPEFNMQNGTITTCMGNFYDSGGDGGAYANNEDYTLTFYPSTPGAMLEFNFLIFDVEYHSSCSYDWLRIYDGINASAPLIGTYCGTNSPGTVLATNASGAITFVWHSDYSVTDIGWEATVECIGGNEPPVAQFMADDTTPVTGQIVQFTDLSSNMPTSWSWSFSPSTVTYVNGTNASSQNPQVQFNNAGYYTVTLTATNAYGSDDEVKVNYINASVPPPPVADFVADDVTPVLGQTVYFTDLSTNGPTSWSWDFDPTTVTYVGGTSSSSQNPQVQFNAIGTYTVSLTVTNAIGSDEEIKNDYITVMEMSPYCDASGGGDEYISGVQLESINNTGTGSDNYADYTNLSTDLEQNATYPITITNGTVYSTDDVGVWIDWNQDGDFYDTGENVVCEVDNGGQGTFTFEVPGDAALGSMVMRVRIKYFNADCGDPCGITTYGEVEDYSVNIIEGSGGPSYCDASGGGDEYISGVQLGSINNTGTGSSGYTDYTYLSTDLEVSLPYDITVTNGNVWSSDDLGVWIDWNQDGDFYDAGENVVCEVDNGGQGTFNFTVPADATLGNTVMRVRIKYFDSDCGDPCGTTSYGEVEDYGINVVVNTTASIPPYYDDFESFDFGDYIAEELYFWTTWSNAPGTSEDAMVVNFSSNGLMIDSGTDAVLLLGNQTSGKYEVGFDMYIPNGNYGYFNLLQDFAGTNSSWGMQVFFDAGGYAHGDANGADNITFSYSYDQYMHVKNIIDLDNDLAEFYFNETLIYSWQWSEGAFGGNNFNQLGGMNLYAWDENGTPLTYIDNVYFVEVVEMDVTLYLEGAFNGSMMDNDLNAIIPLNQPYNAAPWNYNGSESVVNVPANVVDWILVEFRDAIAPDAATSSTVVHRQAAFLTTNGSVVDLDGTSPLEFRDFVFDDLFFVVYHRNHIGIVSNFPLENIAGTYVYDFSTGENQVYGGVFSHKNLGGVWGMAGGDADASGVVNIVDIVRVWSLDAALNGYLNSDMDMNIEVDNKDKDDIWAPNEGMTTGIQTNFVEVKIRQNIPE